MSFTTVVQSGLPLKLLARGKVRDVYDAEVVVSSNEGTNPDPLEVEAADAGAILFIATDRISAFDIILANVRPAIFPRSS
jgi:phosphoribosylaminoimidazole-succinocarboxamide synthase